MRVPVFTVSKLLEAFKMASRYLLDPYFRSNESQIIGRGQAKGSTALSECLARINALLPFSLDVREKVISRSMTNST